MGKQQTARASSGHAAVPSESSLNPRENTARVSMRGNELPGWFWGVLGCLSVLGIGFAVLFLLVKAPTGATPPAPSLAATAPPADGARASARRGPQIDIEPMAPPALPALPADGLPAARPKAAPRPVRVAHSPLPAHPSSADKTDQADQTDKTDKEAEPAAASDSDDAPRASAKTKAKTPAADDDDQPARARKAPATSDDKSDDKEL
jgi:type IV secretory pathway VirB10-like protein